MACKSEWYQKTVRTRQRPFEIKLRNIRPGDSTGIQSNFWWIPTMRAAHTVPLFQLPIESPIPISPVMFFFSPLSLSPFLLFVLLSLIHKKLFWMHADSGSLGIFDFYTFLYTVLWVFLSIYFYPMTILWIPEALWYPNNQSLSHLVCIDCWSVLLINAVYIGDAVYLCGYFLNYAL